MQACPFPLHSTEKVINDFLVCGPLGTGKSVLLREIIKALRKKYGSAPDAVAVTASTGIYIFVYMRKLSHLHMIRYCCL